VNGKTGEGTALKYLFGEESLKKGKGYEKFRKKEKNGRGDNTPPGREGKRKE